MGFASQLSVSEALSEKMRSQSHKAVAIRHRLFAIAVAERLVVEIAEQVEPAQRLRRFR